LGINAVSQLSPLIVILVALWYRDTWDKGLRALFFLYLLAGIFEIMSQFTGGLPLVYHLWTPIEVVFLLYIYSQWSNFNYKQIFILYMIIWVMLRIVGLESLQKISIDTMSLLFASLIFIFIPMYVFEDMKSYQKNFMLIMAIYYGGCLVFILTINLLENKALAWRVHSFFNIIAAIGSAGIYIIRNNDILFSTRSSVGGKLPSIR